MEGEKQGLTLGKKGSGFERRFVYHFTEGERKSQEKGKWPSSKIRSLFKGNGRGVW